MVAQIIQGHYEFLAEAAKAFACQADATVVLTYRAEQVCGQLSNGGWRGLGAEAFFKEMQELVFPALRRLEDALQFAGEMTLKVRDVLREHEEEAARLFRGEGTVYQRPRHPQHQNPPQQNPDRCQPNPTNEGRKFVEAAQLAGIDPVLLGMIVQNEWNHRAYEHLIPFALTQLDSDYSYGVSQIKGERGVKMIQKHPELFSDYPDLYVGGNLDQGRVEWFLFTDEKFNLRVAALYVSELTHTITSDTAGMGLVTTDKYCSSVSLSPEDLSKLVSAAYNQGWNEGKPDDLFHRISEHPTPELRRDAIYRVNNIDHVNNVWSNQSLIESQVGIPLGCK